MRFPLVPTFRLFWGTPFSALSHLCSIITCLLLFVGCENASGPHPAAATPASPTWREAGFDSLYSMTVDPTWQKRWWIEKTARMLRGGISIGPTDNVSELMKLSQDQVVAKFMADPRFGDTVLDFNLYYLGFRPNRLKNGSSYTNDAYANSAAILSTQELMKDGDYFKIFDFFGPYFLPPLAELSPRTADPSEIGLTSDQILTKRIQAIESGLTRMVDASRADGATIDSTCSIVTDELRKLNGLFTPIVSNDLSIRVIQLDENLNKIQSVCFLASGSMTVGELSTAVMEVRGKAVTLLHAVLKNHPSLYNPKTVSEMKPFDLPSVGYTLPWLEFGFDTTAVALQNSSTNLNRKRAAYVLKHFFCDDLDPVGVETPTQHAGSGDPHGSDPSCFACHYKLDPMAGFFRDYGVLFIDFGKQKMTTFDDGAELDRAKYNENWKADPATGRTWNVGYVRSTKNENQNFYGENLDDLSKIARKAPEAMRCLVKRTFEYFVAENQALDAGYLDLLTKQFTTDAAVNTSTAMKNLIAKVVLSDGFSQTNLDPNRCYDFAPGTDPTKAPPCKVAFLLEKNCASCHSSTADSGNLDLKSWITLADGTRTFPHLDDQGQQISAKETLSQIFGRLSTTDEKQRMPKKKEMAPLERDDLFQWAQQEWLKL